MSKLQDEIRTHLEITGESMRSLSLRAGLGARTVSNILHLDGLRPRRAAIEALSQAMGRELPVEDLPARITFATLIDRLPAKVSDAGKARRLAQRLRWLLRAAGWVAELEVVDRQKVQAYFAGTNAATFGLSARSFATYKAEVMTALDVALPRARVRGIADIGGLMGEVHAAIQASNLPQDLKLLSGSFLVWLHDQEIPPAAITTATLEAYFHHRLDVSPKGETVARKHVRRIAKLLRVLATGPEFARFGFVAAPHPFADGRDRYEVADAVISRLMTEFDSRIAPWALGQVSRDGQSLSDFIAWLDSQEPTEADAKRALLRRSGIKARQGTGTKSREASLSAWGFLLPKAQWTPATLAGRRGFVAAGAKALYARTGYLVETLDELTDPEIAWSIATALVDANQTGFQSGYAASVLKMIVKIAEQYLCRPEPEIVELRASIAALQTPKGMSERNIAKLRAFTPELVPAFLSVSDRILDDVNARSDARRHPGQTRGNMRFDIEQCRDIMCALAHDFMLIRAPRSANIIGMRLDWIRWQGDHASIVVPSTEIKLRDLADPDLVLDLTPETSRLLRQFIEKVRPEALLPGDEQNPYLFPGQGQDTGQPYGNLLERLVGWVFRIVGVSIHPHLYHHLIGWIWLREDIGMLPVVQNLLGHRNIQTTIDYYAAIDSSLAMQKWQEHLDARRKPGRLAKA